MPDTLCRLAVQVAGPDRSTALDLVLPAERPLGELMPPLVEAVLGASAEPQLWCLTRMAGAPLDASMSLRESHVQDGDMVVLASVHIPPPRLIPTPTCGVVAATADAGSRELGRGTVLAAGVAGTLLAAAALVWSGLSGTSAWHLWSAATLSAIAATGSVAVGRTDRHLSVVLSTAAVVFATATGILAVPGATWAAASLLAASSAFAMSTLLARLTADNSALTAFVAAAGAAAVAAAVAVAVAPRLAVAGVALAVLALAALSTAPRITILAARLGPSCPGVDEEQAAAAHRVLTGLVAGWSVAVAVGAAAVASAALQQRSSAVLAAAFCADLGVLLVLRLRSHADGARRIWLGATGFVSLCIAALVTVIAAPAHGYWICAAAAVACAAEVRWASQSPELNPMTRHVIALLEYAALVAVVPLAFWVTGLYGLVRDVSLP